MTGYSFQTLHSDDGARVIVRGVVGSRAYGTDRPGPVSFFAGETSDCRAVSS